MKMLLDLSTRSKLLVSFSVVLILLAISVGTSYSTVTALRNIQKTLYEDDFRNAADLLRLGSAFNHERTLTLVAAQITNKQQRDALLQAVTESEKESETILGRLNRQYQANPEVLSQVQELIAVRRAMLDTRYNQVQPAIEAGDEKRVVELQTGVQHERLQQMHDITQKLGDEETAHAEELLIQANQRTNEWMITLMIMGLTTFLVSIGLALLLTAVISRPLVQVSKAAELIADGDLTVEIAIDDRRDEVGLLKRSFRLMVDNLRKQTREMQELVAVLVSSSNEIATAAAQLALCGVQKVFRPCPRWIPGPCQRDPEGPPDF